MWELTSKEPPFHDIKHDTQLALRICQGHRPKITKDTPPFYQNLMQKCWHSDPTQRPTAQEIFDLKTEWSILVRHTQEVKDQMHKAEESRQRNMEIKKETKTPHPGAIYTSRLLTNITNGEKLYYYYYFIISQF